MLATYCCTRILRVCFTCFCFASISMLIALFSWIVTKIGANKFALLGLQFVAFVIDVMYNNE